jgi:hypothetical protein
MIRKKCKNLFAKIRYEDDNELEEFDMDFFN